MHPNNAEEDPFKAEEAVLAPSWMELFPNTPVPKVLSQPCCAQFAVSRDRIRSLPRAKYESYRNWLLETNLSDNLSGRVWEYLWHYIFTGQNVHCPKEHVCNCDGFGMCFGGEEQYNAFMKNYAEMEKTQIQLNEWRAEKEKIEKMKETGGWATLETGKDGEDAILQKQINEMVDWGNRRLQEASERGRVPMNRALEAGRPWKEGDGF